VHAAVAVVQGSAVCAVWLCSEGVNTRARATRKVELFMGDTIHENPVAKKVEIAAAPERLRSY
jgi:hypothetical protein